MAARERRGRERIFFHVDPTRTLLFALLFTAIFIWQADLYWGWWLPTFLGIWAVFYACHLFYVWANNKIQDVSERIRAEQDRRERRGR